MTFTPQPLTMLRALALGVLIAGVLLAALLWPVATRSLSALTGWLVFALWLGAGATLSVIVRLIERTSFYASSRLSRAVLFK